MPKFTQDKLISPSEQAENILLARIKSGQLASGTRLSSTTEIAKEIGLGVNSVQKALSRLATLGYLERRPRMGTIVRQQNQKTMNVFIIVGPDLHREPHHHDRYLTACLENELSKVGYVAHVTSNTTTIQGEGSTARHRLVERLKQEFAHYNPVGIIESGAVFKRFHELSSEFHRPMVSIKSPHMGGDVCNDRYDFMLRSLHRLSQLGCKRLLWVNKVTGTSPDSNRTNHFWNAIRNSDIECMDVIEINDQNPQEDPEIIVQERIHAFIKRNRQLPPSKRINCMLVDEDVLMRGVALALLRDQVSIPEELTICANTNEGVDINFGVPVIAYQNAVGKVAQEAVKLLTARILRQDEGPLPIEVKGGGPDFNVYPLSANNPKATSKRP